MADKRPDELPPHDRRQFFSAGLNQLLRPLTDFLEKKIPQVNLPPAREYIRPPGAILEDRFLTTCYRCGSCVDACPVHAIQMLKTQDEELNGTPIVRPEEHGCAMCEELACMHACPSGALKITQRLAIRMGLARIGERMCSRSHGSDCRICLNRCPLGETAVKLDDKGRIRVIDPILAGHGCTGCGTCQEACPTRPVRAIRVQPI